MSRYQPAWNEMDRLEQHRGVAADDPRNAGPIEFFRPKKVTRESLRQTLAPYSRGKNPAELEAKIDATMDRIARGPTRPDPPLSQPLAAAANPWFGLGTRPDIIEHMWKLDDALRQRCRWVFWGGPALVHPQTGVVFAVGFGTIGYVMRLPAHLLLEAEPELAKAVVTRNPGLIFDISAAGPEWRFISWSAPELEWCRAAFDFAGDGYSR